MVKKIVLDKLEIEEPAPLSEEQAAPLPEEGGAPAKKPASRRLWVSLLAVGLLLAGGGTSYWWFAAEKTGRQPPGQKNYTAAPLQRTEGLVNANDFIITLKDAKGNGRVMVYDLAFELYAGQEIRFRQNIPGIRKIIYERVKQKEAFSLLLPEEKGALKEELNADLGNLLGKKVIKAIYFTKFVII